VSERGVYYAAQGNLISASPGKVVNFEQKILLMSARLIQSRFLLPMTASFSTRADPMRRGRWRLTNLV
jgi:hypothetical protein